MPRTICILLSIASLLLISPAPLRAWGLENGILQPVPIPTGIRWLPAEHEADIDSDGIQDRLLLDLGVLEIRSQGDTRWSSPESWDVQQALVADLNHDLKLEAVLLVSRPFQPWPVDAWLPSGGRIDDFHDARGFSSHVILIGWDGGKFRENWAGSALAAPVSSLAVTPVGENSGEYLVTLEQEYDDPIPAPARRMKVWAWNGFGFSIVSSVDGSFRGMSVVKAADGRIFIITE